MKYFILSLSIMMMVGLIFCICLYQNQDHITFPQLNHPNKMQEHTKSANERKEPQPEPLQPVNNNKMSYTLQNNELNMTYNKGNDWVKVPIEKDLLFEGEYRGNKHELIEGSYILTENRAAFLYSEGANRESKRIVLKYSLDQGKTWKDGVVTESFPSMRFRKVDFLNDQFGYVIISGDRTMSQEYSRVFLTHDGGESWEATTDSGVTRLISDGGFIDETTGFLSFGTINPQKPDFYVTQDGGNTWSEAVMSIPEKYDRIFVQAELPVKEGDHLSVLVNQGPNGDYEGGEVKGKLISKDNGKTWDFSKEVQPNEAE
ncbi:WD40/YVTN/BNR-like repeat-containing protein [Tuberibacillus sp. Marseille-P3662]|uniref:WD40/YVTN/BNR-like repeat-containing protein n=1 Tax=Tuberibacillus sp. Marseille-P3662 TaxID=1965358 RepID=UPI000A1C9E55|nr:oxidoreductase [Tuberibacillus sp. Marseille-P3662]